MCDGDGSSCSGGDGIVGSNFIVDACGEHGGNESPCSDCAGVPNGNDVVEVCGWDDALTCLDCAGVADGNTGTVACSCDDAIGGLDGAGAANGNVFGEAFGCDDATTCSDWAGVTIGYAAREAGGGNEDGGHQGYAGAVNSGNAATEAQPCEDAIRSLANAGVAEGKPGAETEERAEVASGIGCADVTRGNNTAGSCGSEEAVSGLDCAGVAKQRTASQRWRARADAAGSYGSTGKNKEESEDGTGSESAGGTNVYTAGAICGYAWSVGAAIHFALKSTKGQPAKGQANNNQKGGNEETSGPNKPDLVNNNNRDETEATGHEDETNNAKKVGRGSEVPAIQIYAKIPNNPSSIKVEIYRDTTVEQMSDIIAKGLGDATGKSGMTYRLMHASKELVRGSRLNSYGIAQDDTIILLLDIRGGGGKKKATTKTDSKVEKKTKPSPKKAKKGKSPGKTKKKKRVVTKVRVSDDGMTATFPTEYIHEPGVMAEEKKLSEAMEAFNTLCGTSPNTGYSKAIPLAEHTMPANNTKPICTKLNFRSPNNNDRATAILYSNGTITTSRMGEQHTFLLACFLTKVQNGAAPGDITLKSLAEAWCADNTEKQSREQARDRMRAALENKTTEQLVDRKETDERTLEEEMKSNGTNPTPDLEDLKCIMCDEKPTKTCHECEATFCEVHAEEMHEGEEDHKVTAITNKAPTVEKHPTMTGRKVETMHDGKFYTGTILGTYTDEKGKKLVAVRYKKEGDYEEHDCDYKMSEIPKMLSDHQKRAGTIPEAERHPEVSPPQAKRNTPETEGPKTENMEEKAAVSPVTGNVAIKVEPAKPAAERKIKKESKTSAPGTKTEQIEVLKQQMASLKRKIQEGEARNWAKKRLKTEQNGTYEREECIFFGQGRCRNGTNCNFRHSEEGRHGRPGDRRF